MHDCCRRGLEYLRKEQGVDIFECGTCRTRFAVYEIEE